MASFDKQPLLTNRNRPGHDDPLRIESRRGNP